jgi:lipoate-protein ligase A
MGIETTVCQGVMSAEVGRAAGQQKPCFVTASRQEILSEGRKLIGSAQRRLKRSFLQHGSIALTIDYVEMSRTLGCSEGFLRRRTVSLSEAAGRQISFEEAARSLQRGFRRTFTSGRRSIEQIRENYSRSQNEACPKFE